MRKDNNSDFWIFKLQKLKNIHRDLKSTFQKYKHCTFPPCVSRFDITQDTELAPSVNVPLLLSTCSLKKVVSQLTGAKSSHQSGLTMTVTMSTVKSSLLRPCFQHQISHTGPVNLLLLLPWRTQAHSINLCQPLQLLKQNALLPV